MYDLVSIDPGARMGVACWRDGQLAAADLVRDWGPRPNAEFAERYVIELPEIRVQGGGKGDPNQMVRLAFAVGAWHAQWYVNKARIDLIRPHAWKGNVPKEIMTQRILRSLTDAERKIAGTDHNVIDAVGLGLHVLGRRIG